MTVATILLCYRTTRGTPAELMGFTITINGLDADSRNEFISAFPIFQNQDGCLTQHENYIVGSSTSFFESESDIHSVSTSLNQNRPRSLNFIGTNSLKKVHHFEPFLIGLTTKYLNKLDSMKFKGFSSTTSSVGDNASHKMNYSESLLTNPETLYSRKPRFLGFGQPMMDIIVHVEKSFLKKYGLQENNAIKATSVHEQMLKEVLTLGNLKKRPGGTTLNTIRIVQKLASAPHTAAFVGSVGDDENGKLIQNHLLLDNVSSYLETVKDESTGECVVLVEGKNRSLITSLGASILFSKNLFQNSRVQSLVELAQYYYITMFLAAAEFGTDIIIQTAEYSYRMKRCFMLNLGAPFLVKNHSDLILTLLPYTNILFGNQDEFFELGKVNNLDSIAIAGIGKWASNYVGKANGYNKPRIVVITDGEHPVHFIEGDKVSTFPVPYIPKKDLMNTNGAGDAFVGGFVSKFIQKQELNVCVQAGINTASGLIRGEITLD